MASGSVRLDGVRKRYGRGPWVLRNVDLDLPAGEVFAVTGANGSGKSTLLRIVAGVSPPTGGRVSGRPAVVGYVPERFPPDERLSATEYLTHLGRIRGLRTPRAAARADELLTRLALAGDAGAPVRTLSKGNAQKVALAQALLVPPELLVLDEPWSGLDTSAHAVLGEIIGEIAGSGAAVVFTDHREQVAAAHATRIHTLRSGTVRAGTVQSGMIQSGMIRSSAIQVVLCAPVDGPDGARWADAEGVLDAVERGRTVTLQVAADRSDAVLLSALRRGWSVRRVGEPGVREPGR